MIHKKPKGLQLVQFDKIHTYFLEPTTSKETCTEISETFLKQKTKFVQTNLFNAIANTFDRMQSSFSNNGVPIEWENWYKQLNKQRDEKYELKLTKWSKEKLFK